MTNDPKPQAPSGAPPGRPAFKRSWRNYLLDARFQLKFASYIVAINVVIAAMLGVFLWQTTGVLFKQMQSAVDARTSAVETSKELGICTLNNEIAAKMDDPEFALVMEAKSAAIDAEYEQEKAKTVSAKGDLELQQRATLFTLMGAMVAFIVFIALGTIVTTHRIVGPLFRIKRLANEVADGKLRPPTYGLRPGDELKDVFDVFANMVTVLRSRQEGDLKRIDQALAELKASGAANKTVEELVAEFKARLER
jgi:methyl-accepting chemotaxis protein